MMITGGRWFTVEQQYLTKRYTDRGCTQANARFVRDGDRAFFIEKANETKSSALEREMASGGIRSARAWMAENYDRIRYLNGTRGLKP
jgi:hypothetical protein